MEILNTIEEQNKQILKNLEMNAELLEKVLKKPIPSPQVQVDHKTISDLILKQLGDPAAAIKSEMTNFYWRVKEIPTSIKIRGDFYGFTGWRPFVYYIVTLILLAYIASFSWFYNSDNEVVKRQTKQIENFSEKNPKMAKKYFSDF